MAEADWTSASGRLLKFRLLGRAGEAWARAVAADEALGSGWRRIFLDEDRGFKPWKLQVVELDGDSLPELAVGVFKPTRYDPVPDRRLFLFDWTSADRIVPLWLGSRLGYRLEDFTFVRDPAGIDKLLAVEHSKQERLVLRRYAWNGFGFDHELDLVRIQRPPDYAAARDRLVEMMNELARKGVEPK